MSAEVYHVVYCSIQSFIIVISGEGELLTYKVMSDQGVIFPLSLDIDTCGQLWVGCSAYEGESDAKVHILAAGGRFFPGTPVSSTNKTDCCDITEILLKVALNTMTITS
jgi:hypothetical protein